MDSPDRKRNPKILKHQMSHISAASGNQRNSGQVKTYHARMNLNLAVKGGMSPSVHSSEGSPASPRSPGSGRALGASPKILGQNYSPTTSRGPGASLRNLSILKLTARKARLKVRVSKRDSLHSLNLDTQNSQSPQSGPTKISLNLDAILADGSRVGQLEPGTSFPQKSGKKRKKGKSTSTRKGGRRSLARAETSPEHVIKALDIN